MIMLDIKSHQKYFVDIDNLVNNVRRTKCARFESIDIGVDRDLFEYQNIIKTSFPLQSMNSQFIIGNEKLKNEKNRINLITDPFNPLKKKGKSDKKKMNKTLKSCC